MFDGLTNRLSRIMGSVRERGRLNEGDIDGYLLKPMNCPMHIKIFDSRPHMTTPKEQQLR